MYSRDVQWDISDRRAGTWGPFAVLDLNTPMFDSFVELPPQLLNHSRRKSVQNSERQRASGEQGTPKSVKKSPKRLYVCVTASGRAKRARERLVGSE